MPIEAGQHYKEDTLDRKHNHNTNTKFRAHLYALIFDLRRNDFLMILVELNKKKKSSYCDRYFLLVD